MEHSAIGLKKVHKDQNIADYWPYHGQAINCCYLVCLLPIASV